MAELYDSDRFTDLFSDSRKPRSTYLHACAVFLAQVFSHYSMDFAFMGGYGLMVRGSTRATENVDVAVRVDMETLRQVLEKQKLMCVPVQQVDACVTVFVMVTTRMTPLRISQATPIQVDVYANWSLAELEWLDRNEHSPSATNGVRSFPIMPVSAQFAMKLEAFAMSSSAKDYEDLIFMVERYQPELRDGRFGFKTQYRDHFVKRVRSAEAVRNPRLIEITAHTLED